MADLYMKNEKFREFYEACEKIRASSKGYLSIKQAATLAENTECSSFFLSIRQIKRIIWEMNTDRHKDSEFAHIREKHNEIYRRYKELLFKHGDKELEWYAVEISRQKAPRFYIDDKYATVLYYKLIRNRHENFADIH